MILNQAQSVLQAASPSSFLFAIKSPPVNLTKEKLIS